MVDKLPAGFEPLNTELLGTTSIEDNKIVNDNYKWFDHVSYYFNFKFY